MLTFISRQDTAILEAKAYEMEQRTALTAEAKRALDSWVAYEAQVKQREQRDLAESVIGKVQSELKNPRTLQTVLQQSVSDVESKLFRLVLYPLEDIVLCRDLANRCSFYFQGSWRRRLRGLLDSFELHDDVL